MKVHFPEPVSPDVLYERDEDFYDLDYSELEELLRGVRTALNICVSKLKDPKYRVLDYYIVFSRRFFKNEEPFTKIFGDYLSGGGDLSDGFREWNLKEFQKSYKKSLRKVKKDYLRSPGDLNFSAEIIGYKDSVSIEIEVKDPFSSE